MGFSKTYSAHISILEANIVDIEVDLSVGLYHFSIIGLPDKAIEEARDRIGAAIKNTGFVSPKQKNHKVVISLAPANIRKEGSVFDLAMAIAYLLAAKEIEFDSRGKLFLGELSLDGKLRPIKGTLPIVLEAINKGFTEIFVPKENAEEASLAGSSCIYGAETLEEVIVHINTKELGKDGVDDAYKEYESSKIALSKHIRKLKPYAGITRISHKKQTYLSNFASVKGQAQAKRVLEIAAVGKHNVMLYGPPGTGKTMLAQAFIGILPRLTFKEMVECTCIHSISGKSNSAYICFPPLRSPHHTASYVSLVGGGQYPKPGEVTLAHHGVLFADEFPEFNSQAIEAMREPLESKVITLTRAKGSAVLPADFILLATMNPCPCGYRGSKKKRCVCRQADIARYRRKLSGPIIDRIDLWAEVTETEYERLIMQECDYESTDIIAERVLRARKIQAERLENHPTSTAHVTRIKEIKKDQDVSRLTIEARNILELSAEKLFLSTRSFYKTLSVARTIADLACSENIEAPHVLEALQYRPKDFLFNDN